MAPTGAMSRLGVLVLLAVAAHAASGARHPLVFIPGFTGSGLEVRYRFKAGSTWHGCECKTDDDCSNGWTPVWISVEEISKPNYPFCFLTKMRRTLINGRYRGPRGVQVRPIDFGGLAGIESSARGGSNVFDLMEAELGYKRGVDIFGAPYDWRNGEAGLEQIGHYAAFKALVERAYRSNSKRRVILLSHSMGNHVTLSFLHKQSQAWRSKYIKRWILSAPDLGGDLDSLAGWVGGKFFLDEYTNHQLSLTSSAAGLSWLSAYSSAFGNKPVLYTDAKNYTADEVGQALLDMGQPQAAAVFALNHNLTGYVKPLPGLDMFALYGNSTETWTGIYTPKLNRTGVSPVTMLTGPGDGDVSLGSLRQSLKVVRNPARVFEMTSLTHANIAPDGAGAPEGQQAFLALIRGEPSSLAKYSRAKALTG